jgi:hypothetical protein
LPDSKVEYPDKVICVLGINELTPLVSFLTVLHHLVDATKTIFSVTEKTAGKAPTTLLATATDGTRINNLQRAANNDYLCHKLGNG